MSNYEDGLAAVSDATTADVRSLYDEWVTDYERDVLSWGYDAPQVCARRLADLVEVSATRVLDAGCGTGLTGVALAAAGFSDVVGVDLSPESIRHAERRGVYASTQPADLAEPLEFADDHFGALLCCGVFSYVTDLDATLGEFLRVVSAGGPIVVTQRTDLWDDRHTGEAIDRLVASGRCTGVVSDAVPYLPGHPEFGDSVGIRIITLTVVEPT